MRPASCVLAPLIVVVMSQTGCARREQGNPEQSATDTGTVMLADAALPYVVEGAGRPCLFVGSRIYHPRTFSSRFKSQLRCVYLDDRMFVPGAEARGDQVLGIRGAVADIEAARQALGLDRLVLVGHSIYGLIVMAYARQYPEHVTHVIAIGGPPEWTSAYTGSTGPFWDEHASAGRKAVHERNWASLGQDSLAKLPAADAFIATYVANAARYWADSTFDASRLWKGVQLNMARVGEMYDVQRPFSFAGDTGSVGTPVFVALGRFDFAIPYTGWDNFRGPFSNLTVHIFDRAGHTPQLEDSTAFDGQVFGWLAR